MELKEIKTRIQRFIKEFNDKFGDFLAEEMKIEKDATSKYSDWDLECRVNEKINEEVLRDMEKFVKDFSGFVNVGLILTKKDKLKERSHHFLKKDYLHLMGFIANEQHSPFVDLHIFASNEILRKTYSNFIEKDFDDWITLTMWRKILSGSFSNFESNRSLLSSIIKINKEDGEKEISDKLIEYFKNRNEYKEAVDFLLQNKK
jgi:hypothetical protein